MWESRVRGRVNRKEEWVIDEEGRTATRRDIHIGWQDLNLLLLIFLKRMITRRDAAWVLDGTCYA
jgi:hypothetical protein